MIFFPIIESAKLIKLNLTALWPKTLPIRFLKNRLKNIKKAKKSPNLIQKGIYFIKNTSFLKNFIFLLGRAC
jgi:hypothetical protein